MSLNYDDGTYIPLPAGSYPDYDQFDYGSNMPYMLREVDEVARSLGLEPLSKFMCSEDDFMKIEELEDEIYEAEDEDAAELRRRINALRPSHPPAEVLMTVQGLMAPLAEQAKGGDRMAESALAELKAYEIVLKIAQQEGRGVYFEPY